MHTLRKLARAIHRRSVWQVLVAYGLLSWGALAITRVATLVLGLPAWTPALALVLEVIILPLVVATTAVQGGLPGLRIRDLADPNELPGLTPEQVHVVPEAHPLHGSDVLTWRNTVLATVSSAALLVTSVVAYLTMWALGIGPVGSLMAQGLVVEHDTLMLSPFENRSDDSSLAALVTDAFELELSRSWVVSRPEAGAGAKLIVTGDVSGRRAAYVLTSSIRSRSGSTLARFEEDAGGEQDVVLAIERLAERVRERLGESLRTIREGERLASLTSSSEEALRLYRRAGRASAEGDVSGAIGLLSASVAVDPTFALAWRRLGVLAEERGDVGSARGAYRRAIDLWAPDGRAERTVQRLRTRIAAMD